jgi:glutathione S-transferase
VRLYWHPFSVFPRRVRIALREKRIAHDEVVVDLPGRATRTAEFRRLSPFGQVPVLEDDGLVVFESIAILEYLEERVPLPALLPADMRGRARARQWMQASGDYLAPPFKRWITRLFTPEAEWDRANQELAAGEIACHLDVLEDLLYRQDYLAGDYSLADVCYAPFVCELAAAQLGALLEPRPAVHAWVERLRARPAIASTSPSGGS